ncbi:MAG: HAD-IC family P-type ATPase [Gammaproteobacteria bacterium]|nr:HAD-IC family P-type ATPase [Gammaproteobacteria bacterium]
MIIELAMVGSSLGYWLKRRRDQTIRDPESLETKQPQGEIVSKQILSKQLIKDIQMVFSTDRQLARMDGESQQALDDKEQKANEAMYLSAGAMGLATAASIFPILTLPGAAAVLYLGKDTFTLIRRDFERGHYLSFYLVGVIMKIAMIFKGHLLLAAIASFLGGFVARIVNTLESNSNNSLAHIFSGQPAQVWVEKEGVEVLVEFNDLRAGDRVLVHAGEVVSVDGEVIEGFGQVDQHILTGESQPAEKSEGDTVLASTLLLAGKLTVLVHTTGEETTAAKIGEVLNQTKQYKDTLMLRGRETADRYLPYKLGIAAASLPFLGANAGMAIVRADLGGSLSGAGPISVMTYLEILSRKSILVKDGRVFESLHEVDTIVFDKTGTLTDEQPTLGEIHTLGDLSEREVLRYTAAAEYHQPHPVARAILAKAADDQLILPTIDMANYEVGYGIKVTIGENLIRVGSARFMQMEGITISEEANAIILRAQKQSYSLVYASLDDQLIGILEIQPTIRPEAKEMISALKKRGLSVYIISGDQEAPTRNIAEKLGVDHYFAETLPENKANIVQKLRDEGHFVCFVGDGINL